MNEITNNTACGLGRHNRDLAPGALVRTRRAWPGGIHRATVDRVIERDGIAWAEGEGWRFPAADLEVIRPPLE